MCQLWGDRGQNWAKIGQSRLRMTPRRPLHEDILIASKVSCFSEPLENLIYLNHHWPKNLTKILIFYLTGYFLMKKSIDICYVIAH